MTQTSPSLLQALQRQPGSAACAAAEAALAPASAAELDAVAAQQRPSEAAKAVDDNGALVPFHVDSWSQPATRAGGNHSPCV